MSRRPRSLALVLAGGKGSRLGPLTQRRAKPALPFGGAYRLIDFPLTNCVHSGLSDVWVVEQYRPHALNDHLLNGRPWDLDRNRGGLRILPPFTGAHGEGFAEGNADALWRHRALLAESGADELVVLSADHVERVDLRDVLDAHRDAGAQVTMVTTDVPRAEASRFGVVRVDGGRVTDFAYKPDDPAGDGDRATVTTEVFAYDLAALLRTLDALAAEVARRDDLPHLGDFGDHLLPALVRGGRARAVPHGGYWRDVGTPGSYWRGHMDLLGGAPALTLEDPAWPVRTAGVERDPAHVVRDEALDDVRLA
ncbi:sugar phosphate nucleotidyltransferase, partial [Roseisolibacter sp. H3M3-2]|uniref:glucose-1-phosphate adenylyltransferase family protein n=1 Tax=Roseisolibacter sp. H3M3-2 TaxID=3031323 RepID=UPI0023D9A1AB